ncbi:CRISPR-associated protein (Cas_Csy3) [Vibrio chagasii]|nr:CRISPR-associated protein (Cas_Csy3) [Vibrio chagasii]CAH6958909.1 CRISPR-associated protein (Cas_Csy3) [Vibrio chagasii]CAH7309849.1 CRISPR-associated protein (Cas_Csy3) [Vibrio chagasii]CAH7314034.1 CRISPR-associated protein (Cas_Csy3) [Vibrio chagasii]CAH7332890.1 CRISPR-associated protein (Cas_Csy3) [Vibrio chagasii]
MSKLKLELVEGDEIYPSQEFLDSREDDVPTKQLATFELLTGKETVTFHGQEVGAALQSIDDWWHVTHGNDFYQLLRNTKSWIETKTASQTIHKLCLC